MLERETYRPKKKGSPPGYAGLPPSRCPPASCPAPHSFSLNPGLAAFWGGSETRLWDILSQTRLAEKKLEATDCPYPAPDERGLQWSGQMGVGQWEALGGQGVPAPTPGCRA